MFGPRGRGLMRGWAVSDAVPAGKYDVEDLATGLVKFANGASLLIEASWASYIGPADELGLELMGDAGGARLTYEQSAPLTIYTELDGQQVNVAPVVQQIDGHKEELRLFLEAIQHGTPPPATVDQGLVVLKVIEALYASAQKGEAVAPDMGR
jgi:predicted dehydrogenase